MTGREWIDAFAERLGVAPPDDEAVEQLLALAATAAHDSELLAAPLSCYLVGLAGIAPADAARLATGQDPSPS